MNKVQKAEKLRVWAARVAEAEEGFFVHSTLDPIHSPLYNMIEQDLNAELSKTGGMAYHLDRNIGVLYLLLWAEAVERP